MIDRRMFDSLLNGFCVFVVSKFAAASVVAGSDAVGDGVLRVSRGDVYHT
jgi:hypothetical protein